MIAGFLPFIGRNQTTHEPLPIRSTEGEFRRGLAELAERLKLDANAIAAVMQNESGFDPAAVNPSSGASGLIQFMPQTAKGLGSSVEAIRKMSRPEQLPLVEKFFKPFAGKLHTARDHYLAVFMPNRVGHPPDEVIAVAGEKVYDQNKGLDVDHDGVLTVGNVGAKVDASIAAATVRAAKEGLVPLDDPQKPIDAKALLSWLKWLWPFGVAVLVIGAVAWHEHATGVRVRRRRR